jgi:amidohydrolase
MVTNAQLNQQIQRFLPEIIGLRHDLHRNPELSEQEERTAHTVSAILTQQGISHQTRVGGTHGIVAVIEGSAGTGKTLALRGDMDALPIQEENDVPYKSLVPGKMHACGHDGHTSNLVGTALVLNALRAEWAGRVKLLFQPAEEVVKGAKALIDAGAIDDVDAIVMLHGWPNLPAGQIGVRSGPAMASSDHFKLTLQGKGGHAAYPHNTIDPIFVGSQIVGALQSLVAREISPVMPAVVSVTTFHAGTADNIIPPYAALGGTVRTLDESLRNSMPERIERIIAGVCAAFRAEYDFEYHFGTPVTVNTPAITDLIRSVGQEMLGPENVIELPEATMGAEDFAFYVQRVPGAMFRLGVDCEYGLHHPKYNFGDTPLEVGMKMMTGLALRFHDV